MPIIIYHFRIKQGTNSTNYSKKKKQKQKSGTTLRSNANTLAKSIIEYIIASNESINNCNGHFLIIRYFFFFRHQLITTIIINSIFPLRNRLKEKECIFIHFRIQFQIIGVFLLLLFLYCLPDYDALHFIMTEFRFLVVYL